MNLGKNNQIEEEKTAVDTLPTNENNVENIDNVENVENTNEIVDLDNSATPTPEQQADAGLVENVEEPNPTVEDGVENVDTATSEDVQDNVISENGNAETMTDEQLAVETMLTQSQVNEIVGKTRTETRDKTMQNFYDRYGVNNDSEMDSLVGNAQKYETLKDAYEEVQNNLKEATIKLAMVDSGIAPERYEDARLILQGKNLEITPETIQAELTTHPEWAKKAYSEPNQGNVDIVEQTISEQSPAKKAFVKKGPSSTLTTFGNDQSSEPTISEKEQAMNLFGFEK